MDMMNLLSKEEWAQFENELFDRFKINCAVYETSGVRVTATANWCNRLCPQIKANQDSLAAICAPGNQNFMTQAKKNRKPVVGECDAGLMKITVPVFVNGTFLGAAGGCGLLPEGGEVETFMIEKSLGLGKKEIVDLCHGMGSMTEEQGAEMAAFIEKRIADYVSRYVGTSVSDG